MIITLPYPPAKLNPNRRLHWAQKSKIAKKYRSDCGFIASQFPKAMAFKITFHPPCRRKRDRDNVIAAFKAGQDGLADAWGVDDSQFEITYAPLGEVVKGGAVIIEQLSS